MNSQELATKAAVTEEARAEVQRRQRAHDERSAALEAVKAKIAEASGAFDAQPSEKTAVALTLQQHHLPRARAAVDESAAALAGALEIHAAAAAELERTHGEANRQLRVAELTAKAASFEKDVEPLAMSIVDLVGELRTKVAQIFDAHLASRAAAMELAGLTGDSSAPPDGVRLAIGLIEKFRAQRVAVQKGDLAALIPAPVDAWIVPLVGFISRSMAANANALASGIPASPGQLGQTDALLDALRASTNYQETQHKLIMVDAPKAPAVEYVSQVRYPGPFERAR
jgi:hypothetical protein